jgi:lysozyme family protein
MINFEKFIDDIIAKEKGYVDHPSDKGGPTNYGITQAVARVNGFDGPMIEMPLAFARAVYRKRYIAGPKFDKVAEINAPIGSELMDTGVNMGTHRAGEFLQRCLNVFNLQGSRYADVFVDGNIGPVTLGCLKAFLRWRGADGETVLCRALNSQQGVKYIEFAENNPSQEDFVYGWFLHRVS